MRFDCAEFLEELKAGGRCSPEPKAWHRLHQRLQRWSPNVGRPPVPLILAASGASASNKLVRLGEQLAWADTNGCLAAALAFLGALMDSDWETRDAARWEQDFSWSEEDLREE